jgi:hypothetical protein
VFGEQKENINLMKGRFLLICNYCDFSNLQVFWEFALTPPAVAHSISPESSDGFASVGTILPEGKVALLPGGLFSFMRSLRNGV